MTLLRREVTAAALVLCALFALVQIVAMLAGYLLLHEWVFLASLAASIAAAVAHGQVITRDVTLARIDMHSAEIRGRLAAFEATQILDVLTQDQSGDDERRHLRAL